MHIQQSDELPRKKNTIKETKQKFEQQQSKPQQQQNNRPKNQRNKQNPHHTHGELVWGTLNVGPYTLSVILYQGKRVPAVYTC